MRKYCNNRIVCFKEIWQYLSISKIRTKSKTSLVLLQLTIQIKRYCNNF